MPARGLGDVDANTSVDIIDALKTAQNYVGLYPAGFSTQYADVNLSTKIDIVDALLIAQYSVGLFTDFPQSTPTPLPLSITPTPQIAGDTFYFKSVGNGVIIVDNDTSSNYDIGYNAGITLNTAITGYTGKGYYECTNLPSRLYFPVWLGSTDYVIKIRTYNTPTGSWTWEGATIPANRIFGSFYGRYNFCLSFTRLNTIVDRIAIFPQGTEDSLWQDLILTAQTSFLGTEGAYVVYLDIK